MGTTIGVLAAVQVLAVVWSGDTTAAPMPAQHKVIGCAVRAEQLAVVYEAETIQSTVVKQFMVLEPGEAIPSGYKPLCVVSMGLSGSAVYWK